MQPNNALFRISEYKNEKILSGFFRAGEDSFYINRKTRQLGCIGGERKKPFPKIFFQNRSRKFGKRADVAA